MTKRIFAFVLCTCLILAMFAGCGGVSDTSSSTPQTSATGFSDEEPTEETVTGMPLEEDSSLDEEESAEDTMSEEPVSISYPIAEHETLTAWVTLEPPFRQAIEDWNDLSILPNIAEATGVNLEFTTVGSDAASEQFPLMIAGGDWTDLIPISYYNGGDSQAYEDDVIVDLTDRLPTDAPDYWAIAQGMDQLSQDAMISGDKYLTFYTLLNAYYQIQGPCIRQDWLDTLNLDAPTDLDSLTTVLKAFYDNYHPDYTIYTSDGGLDYLSDLFGTMIDGYTTMDGSLPIYVDGEDVLCTYTTDEYRAFLEWFVEMYNYGVINESFEILFFRYRLYK